MNIQISGGNTCMHSYIHAYVGMPQTKCKKHTCIHSFVHTYIHTYIHTYAGKPLTCIHIYIHIHMQICLRHAYIQTYIHTYIHMQVCLRPVQGTHLRALVQDLGFTHTYIHAYICSYQCKGEVHSQWTNCRSYIHTYIHAHTYTGMPPASARAWCIHSGRAAGTRMCVCVYVCAYAGMPLE